MRISDNLWLSVALGVAILTAATIAFQTSLLTKRAEAEESRKIKRWGAYQVLSDPGPETSGSTQPFTLVEFGDYQCPPCRAAFPAVEALRKRHPSTLAFVFRNFPLTHLHPLAMPAALFAEAARNQGAFEPIHRLLYTDRRGLSPKALQSYAGETGLDSARLRAYVSQEAPARIERDIRLTERLELSGTPSFVLCFPDGHAQEIGLQDVEHYIAKN